MALDTEMTLRLDAKRSDKSRVFVMFIRLRV
jgi:hypothetical protein